MTVDGIYPNVYAESQGITLLDAAGAITPISDSETATVIQLEIRGLADKGEQLMKDNELLKKRVEQANAQLHSLAQELLRNLEEEQTRAQCNQDGGETTEIYSLFQQSNTPNLWSGLRVPSCSSRRLDSFNDEGLVQVDLLLEHSTEAAITNRGRVDVDVAHDHIEIRKDTSEIMQLESHFEQENIEPDSIGSARSNDKVEHSDIARCGRPLVEAECINGESNWVSGATTNIQRIDSQQNSMRQRIVKDYGITRKNLEEHFGKYRKDAAKCLRVSVPTFKRICRAYNISRWPHPKTGKVYPHIAQGVSLNCVEPNVVDQQCPTLSQEKGTDNSAHERSTATGKPCDSVMTAKVTYRDDMIKFKLTPSSTKVELEGILEKKLNISLQGFSIKYQDEDNDWVTITEDADLREGMHESRLLGRTTMKLLLTPKFDT